MYVVCGVGGRCRWSCEGCDGGVGPIRCVARSGSTKVSVVPLFGFRPALIAKRFNINTSYFVCGVCAVLYSALDVRLCFEPRASLESLVVQVAN